MPQKQPDKFDQLQAAGAKLYGSSTGGDLGAGTIEASISSFEGRHVAKLRDDPEKLAALRGGLGKLRTYAEGKCMRADDVHTLLTTLHEYESTPRSRENIDQQWPKTFEELRLEHGSVEAAQGVVSRAARVAREFQQAVPCLAGRAGESGAVNDARVVNVLARYAEDSPPPAAA